MDLFLLGAGMGIVGGLLPSPLHMIALTQVALDRWMRALVVLIGAPLVVDGGMLLVTVFFYKYIPPGIAHYVAYGGGVVLLAFATFSLIEMRGKTHEELAQSSAMTYTTVSVATLAELGAPGTWVYWLTLAGPIIAEGRQQGYFHAVPFFAGSLIGYYGASIISVWLMAWGANLYGRFKQHLFLIANLFLIVLGLSYLAHAYFGG